MSEAGDLVNSTLTSVRSIVDTWVPVVLDGSILVDTNKVEAVEFPAISWDTIDLNSAGQYLLAVLNGILDLPIYRTVEFEDPGALGITVDAPTLDETLFTELKDHILPEVTGGAYGIDTLIEQDLFERERDAIMGALDKEKSDIAVTQFTNGLSLPTGEFVGRSLAADIIAAEKLEEVNRKIIADRFALYADAKEYAYKNGSQLAERMVDEYAIKIKTAIAVYAAKVDAYAKKTEAGVKLNSAELTAYKSMVDAYTSQMKALESQYRVMASVAEYGYRTSDEQLGAAIEEAKAKVEIYLSESKADLEEESARLMAYAAVATAALSAINVHASMSESSSYRTSESREASVSYRESISIAAETRHKKFTDVVGPLPSIEETQDYGMMPSMPPPVSL